MTGGSSRPFPEAESAGALQPAETPVADPSVTFSELDIFNGVLNALMEDRRIC